MPQQVGIISTQTLENSLPMRHDRPSLVRRLVSPRAVVAPACCALISATAGLAIAAMGAKLLSDSDNSAEVAVGLATLAAGTTALGTSLIYVSLAHCNLNNFRTNRVVEVERAVQLPVVADAIDRV